MRSTISWMPMFQELTEGCRRSACTRAMCCSFRFSMILWIFCTTEDAVTSWASEGNARESTAPTPAPERARNSLRVSSMGRLPSAIALPLILLVGHLFHPPRLAAEADRHLNQRPVGRRPVPVRHGRAGIVAFSLAQLLHRLAAFLKPRAAFFNEEELPAVVAVPGGSRSRFETASRYTEVFRLERGRLAG